MILGYFLANPGANPRHVAVSPRHYWIEAPTYNRVMLRGADIDDIMGDFHPPLLIADLMNLAELNNAQFDHLAKVWVEMRGPNGAVSALANSQMEIECRRRDAMEKAPAPFGWVSV